MCTDVLKRDDTRMAERSGGALRGVSRPPRLILRMGVITFANIGFVATLLDNDLDFAKFPVPVLVVGIISEAILVIEFV
jgi:hypothetical protein